MKALIIDEPWIGKILAGSKTWEMRKTVCSYRGLVALIRKGSGSVVGIAEVIDSLAPLDSRETYANAEGLHGIPPERQEAAFADGWRTPWVLRNARALEVAVPYDHPSGAVIWVNLAETVVSAIRAQASATGVQSVAQVEDAPMAALHLSQPASPSVRLTNAEKVDAPPVSDGAVRLIAITQGNINNGHIYLPLDMFPADAIGGSNQGSGG